VWVPLNYLALRALKSTYENQSGPAPPGPAAPRAHLFPACRREVGAEAPLLLCSWVLCAQRKGFGRKAPPPRGPIPSSDCNVSGLLTGAGAGPAGATQLYRKLRAALVQNMLSQVRAQPTVGQKTNRPLVKKTNRPLVKRPTDRWSKRPTDRWSFAACTG